MDDRHVSFRGQDGQEAEEFIQSVRRAAFDANKDRDDEWMARFASMCMSGKALRWYESLDDDVQDSWKRLRKAILTRYPPPDEDSIVPSASPAAPAAAPAPSAAAPPPPPGKPFDGCSGVIEILHTSTGKSMGYISHFLRENGTVQLTRGGQGSGQRFTVKNEPSSNQTQLALNAVSESRNNFIGLTWLHSKGPSAPAGYCYAAAVFTRGGDGSGSSINTVYYEGGSEATIWDVAPDGTLSATVDGKALAFYVFETNQIYLFPDFDSYAASRGLADQWDRVNLVFKPE